MSFILTLQGQARLFDKFSSPHSNMIPSESYCALRQRREDLKGTGQIEEDGGKGMVLGTKRAWNGDVEGGMGSSCAR